MKIFKRNLVALIAPAALAASFLMSSGSVVLHAQAAVSGAKDGAIQADLEKTLSKKKFSSVKAAVQDGIVTLTGNVDVYYDKQDADHRAHHVKNVRAVRDAIEVGGPNIPDEVLRDKLAQKLAYVSVGYGTTAFNSFTIGVQNGVVTLGGTAYGPSDKDMALSTVTNYPGVKDVVDDIEVAPVSPMDDQTRLAVAHAVYGFSQLNKYSLDPAKPIRIVVVNGRVTLEGVVDNKGDKDVAYIRARGVPNVFSVTNNLQVAGQQRER